MAYDICKKCQRFFEKNGRHYCEECDTELTESREKISEYLESNPGASIMELVKNVGVKLKDVNIFLEQGGAVTMSPKATTINLRKEEIRKEEELRNKKESLKIKNKFKPRSLRR